MHRPAILFVCACLLVGCGGKSAPSEGDHSYELTGQVTALNAKERTATVNAAAIPNFMEAMTMEYPIKSQPEFNTLKVGERIKATVTVHSDSGYELSDIRVQNGAK